MVGLGMGLQAMAEDFNFYYYVSQWPGSYCAQSSKRCCLPTIGEPDEDFFVFGLYATNSTGAVLRKCPNEQSFEFSEVGSIAGIVPNGRLYQLVEIKKALKHELGAVVGIRCSTNLEREFQLYEVYVCIDKVDATSLIPCSSLPDFKCPDEIRFLAFNLQMLKKDVISNSHNLQVE
ncbi:extracellular ribonuclease LE-like isoform X1 [Amborella trichopoda]|uniref:extracellular ribonuclease LE-like isoform X1 n=1 Tax=Amborella trichopoda TaxID=13333 RepID=UPI0009BECF58|nr:extracellular ribonuclease LE-like isoform X1 [Amborella trichopoda]|eukprot:XP_020523957.1 extracellular ribonuclease LE-like isoform X1 [Amborella trichopoda]